MIKLKDILSEAKSQKEIEAIAEEFITSNSYDKTHDCKQSTYEFVKWLKKTKGIEPEVLLLAPPKDFKKFPGKSGTGDSHIFSIVDKIGIDFTANQFPGVTNTFKITLESKIPSEYKKIGGYYTLYADWFPEETNGGKTFIKTTWSKLPSWMKTSNSIEDSKPI